MQIYATRIAVLTRMPAVVITVPYRQGDSTSSIRQTYGTARGRILTPRSTAVAVYGTVDSPNLARTGLRTVYYSLVLRFGIESWTLYSTVF